jgi:hypothetical protein
MPGAELILSTTELILPTAQLIRAVAEHARTLCTTELVCAVDQNMRVAGLLDHTCMACAGELRSIRSCRGRRGECDDGSGYDRCPGNDAGGQRLDIDHDLTPF